MNAMVAVANAVGVFGVGGCLWFAGLWLRELVHVGDDGFARERLCYRIAPTLIAIVLTVGAMMLANVLS